MKYTKPPLTLQQQADILLSRGMTGDKSLIIQRLSVVNNRIFAILTICKYCMDKIAPQSHWSKRLCDLLTKFPEVPKLSMGFTDDWQNCPIWKQSNE